MYKCYKITGLEFVARLIPSPVMKLSEEIGRLSIILSIPAHIEVQQDARIQSWLTRTQVKIFWYQIEAFVILDNRKIINLTHFSINIILDTCHLRLDFEAFDIMGPSDSNENGGGACVEDRFVVTQTPASMANIPVICGLNTGQHGEWLLHILLIILFFQHIRGLNRKESIRRNNQCYKLFKFTSKWTISKHQQLSLP